jgi:outer membrane protein assembly factor BamB
LIPPTWRSRAPNGTGSFEPISITVPAAATPGTHWISAEGRHSGRFAQKPFTVNTNWGQFHYSPKHKGVNPFENVLSPSNVSAIDEDWSFTTGNVVFSSPAVANRLVYVGSDDGNMYAFDLAGGLAAPNRPSSSSLHPNYKLRQQK